MAIQFAGAWPHDGYRTKPIYRGKCYLNGFCKDRVSMATERRGWVKSERKNDLIYLIVLLRYSPMLTQPLLYLP